jgi:hypothetical protein
MGHPANKCNIGAEEVHEKVLSIPHLIEKGKQPQVLRLRSAALRMTDLWWTIV